MKRHNDISLRHIARLLTGVMALCPVFASISRLDAQAADTFAASLAVPARGAAEKPGKDEEPNPVDDKPSRYAGQDILPRTRIFGIPEAHANMEKGFAIPSTSKDLPTTTVKKGVSNQVCSASPCACRDVPVFSC
jgi:hypothetical protein